MVTNVWCVKAIFNTNYEKIKLTFQNNTNF